MAEAATAPLDAGAAVPDPGTVAEIKAAAEAALQAGDVGRLEALFAPGAHLYSSDGATVTDLPRDAWLAQVAARPKLPASRYAIELVDISGPHTALARVLVFAGPRLFRDYLNFLKVGASWQVIAKIYRPVDRPAA